MSSYLGSKSSQSKAVNGGRRPDAPAGLGDVDVMFDRSGTTKFVTVNKKTDSNDQPILDADGNQIEVRVAMYRVIITGHGPCVIRNVDGVVQDVAPNQYRGYSARIKIRPSDTMLEEDLENGVLTGSFDGSMEAKLDEMVAEQFVPFRAYSNESYAKTIRHPDGRREQTRVVYNPGTLHVSPNQ